MEILCEIGGSQGKGDGAKILESVVHKVIQPAFLPKISWSGRGRGNETKIALCQYSNVINLISIVVNRGDRKFNQGETEKCLKYKIIKYAPTRFGEKTPKPHSNIGSTDSSSDGSQFLETTSTHSGSNDSMHPPSPPVIQSAAQQSNMYHHNQNLNVPTQNQFPLPYQCPNYAQNIPPQNIVPQNIQTQSFNGNAQFMQYNQKSVAHSNSQSNIGPIPESSGPLSFQHAFNAMNNIY